MRLDQDQVDTGARQRPDLLRERLERVGGPDPPVRGKANAKGPHRARHHGPALLGDLRTPGVQLRHTLRRARVGEREPVGLERVGGDHARPGLDEGAVHGRYQVGRVGVQELEAAPQGDAALHQRRPHPAVHQQGFGTREAPEARSPSRPNCRRPNPEWAQDV